LPAMRAALSAATSLAGQPTERAPSLTGFAHSFWSMRK
jgi:hypothetical protein